MESCTPIVSFSHVIDVTTKMQGHDSPDEGNIHDRRDNRNCGSLFLLGLPAGTSAPAQDQRIDAIGTNCEDDHGYIAADEIHRRAGGYETDGGDDLGDGDVPCPLIELSRRPRHRNRDRASYEIGRARQNKRYRLVEAQGLDDGREEVLEAVRC